jgi:hypothetical protein
MLYIKCKKKLYVSVLDSIHPLYMYLPFGKSCSAHLSVRTSGQTFSCCSVLGLSKEMDLSL